MAKVGVIRVKHNGSGKEDFYKVNLVVKAKDL